MPVLARSDPPLLEKMESNEGGPFGAIVVKDAQIVGRGWNRVTATDDPTAHAEIVAIRDACSHLNTFSLADCVLYASCEPCPLCWAASYWCASTAFTTPPPPRTPPLRALTTPNSPASSPSPTHNAQSRWSSAP